jgi:hypothetical protein
MEEDVCRLHFQTDYFEIPGWETLTHPLYNTFY